MIVITASNKGYITLLNIIVIGLCLADFTAHVYDMYI